jgi:hypothetical protein
MRGEDIPRVEMDALTARGDESSVKKHDQPVVIV